MGAKTFWSKPETSMQDAWDGSGHHLSHHATWLQSKKSSECMIVSLHNTFYKSYYNDDTIFWWVAHNKYTWKFSYSEYKFLGYLILFLWIIYGIQKIENWKHKYWTFFLGCISDRRSSISPEEVFYSWIYDCCFHYFFHGFVCDFWIIPKSVILHSHDILDGSDMVWSYLWLSWSSFFYHMRKRNVFEPTFLFDCQMLRQLYLSPLSSSSRISTLYSYHSTILRLLWMESNSVEDLFFHWRVYLWLLSHHFFTRKMRNLPRCHWIISIKKKSMNSVNIVILYRVRLIIGIRKNQRKIWPCQFKNSFV